MAEQKVKGITPARGVPGEWVEIGKDGIDGTQRVAPRSVDHWKSRGWHVVEHDDPAAEEAPVTEPAAAPAPAEQPAITGAKSKAPRPGVDTGSES
ncbi:MAG TPA: hypothetical protein VIP28_15195 [Nocardioides sp.]